MTDLATHYIDEARRQLRGQKRLAEGAIAQLKDEELFSTLDPEANSVAILIKHLAGNMRSRFTDFLTTDGEKPDRFRDQEFELTATTTRADVMRWWEEGWARVFAALDSLKPEEVMHTVTIRGEPHTVLQAVNRQIAHYAGHIGQIIFLAKHLRSNQWNTLSIPRGKSEDYKVARPKPYKPQS
ncbi:MAG: DUF1572 family protein [Candidatus Sulfotelmatobacter sp.]